ncbi:ATP-binding protein [Roseateles saccharophilus]|uniref:histidine kinase n=1 Tax=Roseateles saccharophilus TaxID=304 RepID=A0A4V2VPY2_ROSSA|nr:ATP-binding protein [Roseateles saccharophilus]MDG0833483.1 hypothetical protein [Roseateles saccharophilus]TCU92509.1 histidine kinase/DNA gyrase B/HSP90-like ATPase [Roseateles saccharophilus]
MHAPIPFLLQRCPFLVGIGGIALLTALCGLTHRRCQTTAGVSKLRVARKFPGKVEDAVIHVGTGVGDGQQVCFVSDNGAGFDVTHVSRLLDAFQYLHHEVDFRGTGVGLAIAQRVMRRHGWLLGANASVSHGATFHFRLTEHDDER